MDKTIEYYNNNPEKYVGNTISADMRQIYDIFLKYVPNDGHILDVGCGSGRDSLYFISKGYNIESIDGSIEMCINAESLIGKKVKCVMFQNLEYFNEFDAAWACASLLHIPKEEQKLVWGKLYMALKDKGIIYASYKKGAFEGERDGRFFLDYEEDMLSKLVYDSGFTMLEKWVSSDVRPDNKTQWINIIAKKILK
ncbi:MAG: tellurite resistance protein TehB [Firmicutes bacterium ADurb.Bin080]|jgi:SAM-dependent methyltransferase|nr:MAG: tellurite resistance protein TehB [Firmicutes bacterium ADurb.Bin080]